MTDSYIKARDAAAESYATGGHAVSFPDTSECCAFSEGADWCLTSPVVMGLVETFKESHILSCANFCNPMFSSTEHTKICVERQEALAAFQKAKDEVGK